MHALTGRPPDLVTERRATRVHRRGRRGHGNCGLPQSSANSSYVFRRQLPGLVPKRKVDCASSLGRATVHRFHRHRHTKRQDSPSPHQQRSRWVDGAGGVVAGQRCRPRPADITGKGRRRQAACNRLASHPSHYAARRNVRRDGLGVLAPLTRAALASGRPRGSARATRPRSASPSARSASS